MKMQTCDTECYKDYWLAKFRQADGTLIEFASWPGHPLDCDGLRRQLAKGLVYTFNGMGYDKPMISAALMGYDNQTLKNLNDTIIRGGVKYWEFYRKFNIPEVEFEHIDVIEVAPGVRISLKMYAGRMHSRRMQDLPIEPSQSIGLFERLNLSSYCGNDLEVTADLVREVKGRLDLRRELGEQYGIDVMSKSDAQIAESVYRAKLPSKPQRITLPHGHTFKYEAPPWISFVSQELKDVLQLCQTIDFTVMAPDQVKADPDDEVLDSDGRPIKAGIKIPKALKGRDITIGRTVYRMGMGGLHSKESQQWFRAELGKWTITDHDVASYYPTLMLLMRMYPAGTGPAFIELLREIYDQRLHAKSMIAKCKAAGDKEGAKRWKTISDGLKIVLNGTYGKLGSPWSFLFAPELMIRTTVSGQLAMLMLIEMLEMSGIRCISANTDGIVLITARGREKMRDQIIAWWESATGLETEATEYSRIYSANVNNYIAFKPDGTHKAKGWYGESGVSPDASPTGKHPTKDVCNDAVIAYLRDGTPLAQTIRSCTDIRRFLVIRQVKGGGYWSVTGEYLGKALRWYYGTGAHAGPIVNKEGNQVATSAGAVPMMQLGGDFPGNVDYDHYVEAARELLSRMGIR